MAEIVPFRGVFYDAAKVGGLADVVSPPYDVLSPEEQDALYAASPYNFVRVILNRAEAGDDESAPYARAARCLRDWLASGVLAEDSAPAFYLYRQEFTSPADGARLARTGLVCALRLEPYAAGVVLPHEETRAKAREDRLRLMRATRANPEPIFGLFEDPSGFVTRVMRQQADASAPLLRVQTGGDRHLVWRVVDADATAALQRFMRERRVWIADGHHRYETALAYRDEMAGSRPSDGSRPRDYILMALAPFSDPGIVVLPTHRLARNIPEGRLEQLPLQLERYFAVEPAALDELPERMAASPADGTHRFGMASREGAWVLTLRDEAVMDAAVEGHAPVWKRLDVSILHALVLERSLGIPAATLATTPDIGYTRDRAEALARVRSGEYQLAFLLNLPTADEVRRVAAAGDRMPPKSTYFYPKLWSGLFLRRLDA